jgi:hypothetical protein
MPRTPSAVMLVDHVDLEPRVARRIDRTFEQRRHLVDATVAGGIEFDVVDEPPGIDRGTRLAPVARRCGHAALAIRSDAVECLGKNARERRLTHPAGTGKQVGVMQSLLLERMRQRPNDMVLPDQR